MPADDAAGQIADLISVPVEELLVALGSGIGRAQAELDRHSIATQTLIDEDPVLSQYGLQATWYQIPRSELELKVAVAMGRPPATAPTLVAGIPRPLPKLWVQPINARYQSQFEFDVQAASTVKLSIAAVPPPALEAAAATPLRTREEVLARAEPLLVKIGTAVAGRVTITYNAAQDAWIVVQAREEEDGTVSLLTMLKLLDTEELEIVRQTGGT
jgi:hypothetical protein